MNQKTATVRACATCPHCRYNLNEIKAEPHGFDRHGADNPDIYDNGHDGGRGGFRTSCESCGQKFVIERETVNDLQHVCLVMLGEA